MAKKKPRNKIIDLLQYFGLRLVEMTIVTWPIDVNLRFCKLIGDFFFTFDKRHRERALHNLRRAFPEKTEAWRRNIARRSMQHLFMLGAEIIATQRVIHVDTFARHVELTKFDQTLEMLLRREHGMVVLTGHFGNWEILGYVMGTMGFETTSVARTMDNPYINNYVMGMREKHGQKIVDKKGATEPVIQALDDHGVVGFIADQNAGAKGCFVDFFGRKASTYKSIALVAMQFKVPVIIGGAKRLNDRFKFEFFMQDIIWPKEWESQDDPLRYITQRYSTALENVIRTEPSQYLWAHRRWRTRPKGEIAEPYD
jgi:Kdo2-lipid IVA lauroyltransferase/acyltransferase